MSDRSFVDSNIWLYALVLRPGEEKRHQQAQSLINAPLRRTISEQVIAEVSFNLLRKAKLDEARLFPVVESFYGRCNVVAPHFRLHRSAHLLRQRYLLSFWDSLIVAAALESHCEILYSEDLQHGLLVDGRLKIINPFLEG
ncbi:MAG: PIN domain-containing protein [Rhodocyclaceae bacterium]|nr:PIN domain-containing protein [Rhodocyclaceae bacterium]